MEKINFSQEVPPFKETFLQNFDEQKLLDTVETLGDTPESTLVYKEDYPDKSLTYSILVFKEGSHLTGVEFYLKQEDSTDKEDITLSDISLAVEQDEGYIDMYHRKITSQAHGIGGTTFLKKAEVALKALMDQGLLESLPVRIEAGQASVIAWALKNGYGFSTEAESRIYEKAISGTSEKILTDVLIEEGKDPYIVEFTDDHWQEGSEIQGSFQEELERQLSESENVTLLRFILEKDLTTDKKEGEPVVLADQSFT